MKYLVATDGWFNHRYESRAYVRVFMRDFIWSEVGRLMWRETWRETWRRDEARRFEDLSTAEDVALALRGNGWIADIEEDPA